MVAGEHLWEDAHALNGVQGTRVPHQEDHAIFSKAKPGPVDGEEMRRHGCAAAPWPKMHESTERQQLATTKKC